MADREYLTPEQAAEILQLHARTVRRLLKEGKLPGQRIGGGRHWRISAAALRGHIEGSDQKPKPAEPDALSEDQRRALLDDARKAVELSNDEKLRVVLKENERKKAKRKGKPKPEAPGD